jgi:release factor glutamine methyltransferase
LAEAAVLSGGASVGVAAALGRQILARAGCETPRLDAELLLASALGVGRERLVIDRDRVLDAAVCERYSSLLGRRAAHEPVAYILGRRDFRHLTLAVDRRVLIPRPETELLVEVGLELAAGARVLDVGTGSGAVALALKDERPDLVVSGVDVSSEALVVARANAVALGLEVSFVQGDLLSGSGSGSGPGPGSGPGSGSAPGPGFRPLDAVLANLPYVAGDAELEPEITRYEPAGALFAGRDGLDVVRRLISEVAAMSAPPSLLALEIAPDQAAEVAALVGEAGFTSVEVRRDLAGLDRVVVGTSLVRAS